HGGGVRIPRDTPEYETLRAWIAAGTPMGDPKTPRVVSIRVEPKQRLLTMKGQQQLRVIARYSDLRETDVTAHAKFQTNQDGIAPSELADDADYLRRVYIDVIGTLPTAAEARRFLADKRTDKRARLVDELLDRPEYADYWALQWADVLRVDRQALGHKRAYAFYRWIRDSVAQNKPFDRFA